MYPEICLTASNLLLVLLQMEEKCWSKLSSESILIPSKVSAELVVCKTSSIDTLIEVLCLEENSSNQG